MVSDSSSESETLTSVDLGLLDRERDFPVHIDSFIRNVRTCKAFLGVLLPLATASEVFHVLALFRLDGDQDKPWGERADYEKWQWDADALAFLMLLVVDLYYFVTLFRSVSAKTVAAGRNLQLHRLFCMFSFLLIGFAIAAHALPQITYIYLTHRDPQRPRGGSGLSSPETIGRVRWVLLVASLCAVGFMRRGPQRRYAPRQVGTGFGVVQEARDDKGKKTGESMLGKKDEPNVLDYAHSSMFNFITLTYISSIARRSLKEDKLLQSHLPHLEDGIRNAGVAASLWPEAEGQLRLEDPDHPPRQRVVTAWGLIRATWRGRGFTVFVALLLETVRMLVSFLQIAAVHEIIETFKAPKGTEAAYAYLMCWGLFVGQALEVWLSAYNAVRENYLLHQPVRMTLSSLLFSKILRSTDAKAMEAQHLSDEEKESGRGRSQVMNLLIMDTAVIAGLATKVWNLTNAIIGLTIGTYMLWQLFGISSVVGIGFIPLTGPFGYYIAKNIYQCDKSYAKTRDARIGGIKEMLMSIKVIKLNAWEPHFRRSIQRLRDVEVKWQRWRFTLGTLFNIQADQMPVLAILLIFAFHTKILGRPLDPAAAFVAIGILNRVKNSLSALPDTVGAVLEAKVAFGRLTDYLNQPEIIEASLDSISDDIKLEDATVGWPTASVETTSGLTEAAAFKLTNVTLELPKGKFSLICGPLGSGKSLFLRALLGEARILFGKVQSPRSHPDSTPVYSDDEKRVWTEESWLIDSVAYSPQQAFIRHGTIRDNILFGQPFWRERYHEALRQACLLPDLDIMQDGDMTEVGEKGTTLSGGQKARINLARCIYSRSKTVYLDDILSAVDAHTAQYIFEECLQTGLLRGRTVVLVTHHVGLCLPGADYFVAFREGKVERACPTSEIRMSDVELAALAPQKKDEEAEKAEADVEAAQKKRAAVAAAATSDAPHHEDRQTTRSVFTKEQSSSGRVARNHYMLIFLAAGGITYWVVLFVFLIGTRLFEIAASLEVAEWSNHNIPSEVNYFLALYAGLTFASILLGAIRWIWLYGVGNVGFYNSASRKVHAMLLDKICGAPLSFFEATPMGRLMNIFGQDMGRLDGASADDFGRCVMEVLTVASALLITVWQAPLLLVVFFIAGIPFYWVSGHLGKLRADLRRLFFTCFTPLISLYHDSIDGVVMIRAFGSTELALASLNTIMNLEKEATVADYTVYNWVRAVMQTMTSIVVTACGFMLVRQSGTLSASQAGFVLSFALQVSQGLFSLLERFSSLEQTFVSAERINHYIRDTVQEPTGGVQAPPSWPSQGRIKVENLSMRYAPDLPDVLKGISFDIEPGMRVGLVGSTGSGKSTLALTLFRAVEPTGGSITIDGYDISEMNLSDLRSRLNMVVQDGTLCSGSLREALDMTLTKDDAEIYEALRRVHLLPDTIDQEALKENPFADLDTFVAVEGSNFSQGQRQLLCLARALLKQSKILVMDEATSSVDFEMDAKITQTIKECFAGTTMLVIAHRLATIMHYDKVLVLDKGVIIEDGRPVDLIQKEGTAFNGLCMAQGPEEFEKLLAMARA